MSDDLIHDEIARENAEHSKYEREMHSLLLRQARYVLLNLDIERPRCGYAKMAAACEIAATESEVQ